MEHAIERIEISHHRLPLDPPFVAAWDSRPRVHFDATVVRVRAASGLLGIGSGDAMVGFEEGYAELFLGRDPRDHERHFQVLDNIAFHAGRCWPLDLALWDLAGKIAGEPVWRMLGGRSDRARGYASLGVARGPEALADQAQALAEQGFAGLKARIPQGRDWGATIAGLEAVRARLGDTFGLMLDCNQGWRQPWDTAAPWTLGEALEVARACDPLGLLWLEEPLHRADRAGMAALRAQTSVPIAGGEMNRELSEFRDLIEGGCLDILQPDAALTGGITGLAKVAAMAREARIGFTPHTWTNGLGVMANAHLACGAAGSEWLEFPYDPPAWSLERRDFLLAGPVRTDDHGRLALSERPGLGVELDEEALARTRL